MVNLQLWSASGLAQIVKWITPYGWIWTPILDDVSGPNLDVFQRVEFFFNDALLIEITSICIMRSYIISLHFLA